jgi:hypothetical protein
MTRLCTKPVNPSENPVLANERKYCEIGCIDFMDSVPKELAYTEDRFASNEIMIQRMKIFLNERIRHVERVVVPKISALGAKNFENLAFVAFFGQF